MQFYDPSQEKPIASSVQGLNSQQANSAQTQTGWWSKLTGGDIEKKAAVAQAEYDRHYQAQQAVLGRQFSSAEAQKNRDYQTYMSNTAYQRGIADMRKAGLNPALFYSKGSGASTPAGSAASAGGTPSGGRPSGTASSTGQLAILLASVVGTAITAAGKIGAATKTAGVTKKVGQYARKGYNFDSVSNVIRKQFS